MTPLVQQLEGERGALHGCVESVDGMLTAKASSQNMALAALTL